MDREGELVGYWKEPETKWVHNPRTDLIFERAEKSGDVRMAIRVATDDHIKAIKVANEYRAKLIAFGLWGASDAMLAAVNIPVKGAQDV